MDAVSDRERTYHWHGADDMSAYIAAALTCKLFYEPAMDCLWEILPSLTFLMTTLPRDAWSGTPKWYHDFVSDINAKVARGQTNRVNQVLLREPARDEWARFFAHARRVRYLTLVDSAAESTSLPNTLRAIVNAVRSDKAPFPMLRHLDLSLEVHAEDLPYLTILFSLSPSLEEFTMTWRDTPLKETLLASLIGMRPAISSLKLFSWHPSSPEDSLIMKFTKLRKFSVSQSLRADTLYRLSSFDTLQVLDVNFSGSQSLSYHIDDIIRPHDAFPNLTDLKLGLVEDADTIVPFLSRMSCHRLRRLELAFLQSDRVISGKFNRILETIARFPALSRLSLRQTSGEPDDLPSNSTCSIRPLFRLRHLERLSVRSTLLRSSFTDDAIAEFGRAWPRLVTLSYERSFQDDGVRPLPTLRVLPLCATHLPNLRWLALELDAIEVPAPLPAPLSQTPTTMVLDDSVVDYEDFARIAEYIASVYPRADVLVNAAPEETVDTMFWTNVGSVVPVIGKLREENRRLKAALGEEKEI
ncbi:hypothetical protein PsYK624_105390 [Phanerochaete sordida]|uniref:F-box domain-containing protein n=1 Tax=Phanerochaete sordida TaxID=48140 RepID=A0A9P3GG91_9APHY|nr:hypothetical protein PsYK624_105390 [Phanerochaete sordida]